MERGVVKHVGVNSEGLPYGFIVPESGGSAVYFNRKGGLFVIVTDDSGQRFGHRGDNLSGCSWQCSPFPAVGRFVFFSKTAAHQGPRAEAWCEEQYFLKLVEQAQRSAAESPQQA